MDISALLPTIDLYNQQQLLLALQTLLHTKKGSTFICNSVKSSTTSDIHYQIYEIDKLIQPKSKSRIILMQNCQALKKNQKEYQQYFGVNLFLLGGGVCQSQNQKNKCAQQLKQDSQNFTKQQLIAIQALQKTNENDAGLITFDISTEHQLKVFFNKKDTKLITTLDRLIQVHDQQYKNQHLSKKYNENSIRTVQSSLLKYLARQLQEGKNQIIQNFDTELLDMIRTIQIVGNQETLEQLRVEQQHSQNQLQELQDHGNNDTVLHDAFTQILDYQPAYLRLKEGCPDTIKFFKDDIILLESISRGGQGEVRAGFHQKTKQLLAIKHFITSKADYKRERNMYKHLTQNGCSDLVQKLLEFDDESKILVLERGICDLKTFAELRREEDDSDGPLTAFEVLLVMEYVAMAMQKLSINASMSLCDTKEENILIKYSAEGLGGYKPILTDLGSAYCKQVDKQANYPVAYSCNYFNSAVLQSLQRSRQLRQTAEDEKLVIQSEIYTLGRMIQSLLSYCLPQKTKQNFKILRQFFQEHSKIQEYFQLFKNTMSKFKDNQGYLKIAQLVENILIENRYDNYQIVIDQIKQTKLQVQQISEAQKLQMEFLSDSCGSTKKWQQNLVTKNSDVSLLTVEQLQQQSEFYHQQDLFTNSIAINQKLLEKLDLKLKELKDSQFIPVKSEFIEIYKLQCQSFKYLGCAFKNTGNVQKSLEYHEMELKLRTKILQKKEQNSDEIAECYSQIGNNNLALGNIKKADTCFQMSLKIKKQIFGENNINLSDTYMYIGRVYDEQGKLDQALKMYTKCLETKKAHYGDNNFNLASTYSNIGGVYRQQGKLEQALEMYTNCLNIQKEHYGDNNFNLAGTFNNIGGIYNDQGNLDQASEMFIKCLNIKKTHYGENNFNLAATYNNIGSLYKNQGKLEQALEMYTKCLNIKKAHYGGDNNFNLAITYYNMSLLLHTMNNLKEALQLAQKSYHIYQNHYGKDDQHTKMAKQKCDQLQRLM